MTMIKKMAKQIAEDFGVKPFLEYENNKTFYENVAKSALKAMLEPSDMMLITGGQWVSKDDPFGIKRYQEMIQAAIDGK